MSLSLANDCFAPAPPCLLNIAADNLRTALAGVPAQRWEQLPEPGPREAYSREVLVESPDLLVIAARWRAGGKCDLHGHGPSGGLYRVVSGRLEEERYVPRGDEFDFESELLDAGETSFLPAGSFHQLRSHGDSVSLHAYAPRPDDALSSLSLDDRERLDRARRASPSAQRPRVSQKICRGFEATEHGTVEALAATLAHRWGECEADAYRHGSHRVPYRVLEDIRSSGILAAPLPRAVGGLAATLPETARAVTRLAERAPAAALALVMPLGNAATCRIPLSSVPGECLSSLRRSQRWMAEQVAGGRILAVANSEPGAGGQLSQTRTVATTHPDGVVRLTGRKTFATLGPDADYFLCAARTSVDGRSIDEHGAGAVRIDGYFIHRDAPGLTIDSAWNPFGMRPTASVGLQLQDVPVEGVLGYPGCLEGVNARHWSTLLFSAVFLGIGRASLREGLKHGGGSTWARAKLAEHTLALDAASGFLDSTCQAEAWPMPRTLLDQVQRVKTFVTQAVVEAATQVAMLCGGRCYAADHPVYRLLADALAGPQLRPPMPQAMDGMIVGLGVE